ncbi:ubiquitin-like protein Pup [Actinomyces timonensis]|uniref:Prokaryotic ubiquitin-like protein Pup n=1 Tax=Actinomyces timonensis TaxID=1288391 RepID=A0AAU8N0P9_9ACTO
MSETAQPQSTHHDDPAPDDAPEPGGAGPARGQDLGGVLDMIDDVLAVGAQEFVQGFVQKGGQ